MGNSTSWEEIVEAMGRVRDVLDKKVFEHMTVDIELEGELCVIGSDHKHLESEAPLYSNIISTDNGCSA